MKRILKFNLGVITALLVLAFATSALAVDEYFIYAHFDNGNTGGLYQPGQGVGSYPLDAESGLLYIAREPNCEVYKVSIPPGSDPNTHPDNPDDSGSMVPRTLTWVGSYNIGADMGSSIKQSQAAFYIDDNYVYYGPCGGIHRWDKDAAGLPTAGTYTKVVPALDPGDGNNTLAYDPATDTWYSGESNRKIYSIHSGGLTWTYGFTHTDYGGDHHDGLEYRGGFLWISDMTSDFVGKWQNVGGTWTELAVYSYSGGGGWDVENLGGGALGHFWATGWDVVYELGGGGLQVPTIPTLTEWGMIIFCVLLFGWMAWVIVHRRRRMTIGV
jgi:hypothetical protein